MIIRLYNARYLIGRFLVDDDIRMVDRVIVYNGERFHAYYDPGGLYSDGHHFWRIEQPELIVTDEHRMNTIDGPVRPEEGNNEENP